MTTGTCPVIPYVKQDDPRSNRMCGAACLEMVYRSLAATGDGSGGAAPSPRKRGLDRRGTKSRAPGGRERRTGRRRTEELTQAEIWPKISKPNRAGNLSSATHLMVADARSRGFAAMAIQVRYPLVALLNCRDNGIRAILNHRLRSDGPAGHYSVLLDVDAQGAVLHDPFYGPARRVSHAELLDLWQPKFGNSEIAGYVLIGIAARAASVPPCPLCATPLPKEVACPRCARPVALSPAELLGCVGAGACLARLWNYVCCPACDNMWNFALAPGAPAAESRPEDGIWHLAPLFRELDKFRDRALGIPGVSTRPDVLQQLDLLEKCKLDLKLAEEEEMARAKEREAQVAAMKETCEKDATAVGKAREEAAKPPVPVDGVGLGDALLMELGIHR